MKDLNIVIGSLGGCIRGICSNCEYYDSENESACTERLMKDALEYLKRMDDLRKDIETLHRINEDWRWEVARLHQRIVEARDLGAKTGPVVAAAEKPGTNYQKIVKMGPWALADWIFRTGTICECCDRHGCCGIPEDEVTEEYCLEHILMWLAQEVAE